MSAWTRERYKAARARCAKPANGPDILKATPDDHFDLRDALDEIDRLQEELWDAESQIDHLHYWGVGDDGPEETK